MIHKQFSICFIVAICMVSFTACHKKSDSNEAQKVVSPEYEDVYQDVDLQISEQIKSADYQSCDPQERIDIITDLLLNLATAGSITNGSIKLSEDESLITYEYSNGALGGVMLEGYADGVEGINPNYVEEYNPDMTVKSFADEIKWGDVKSPYKERDLNALIMYGLGYDNILDLLKVNKKEWSDVGLQTELDEHCTLEDFRSKLSGNELIVIREHGNYSYKNTPMICLDNLDNNVNILDAAALPLAALYKEDLSDLYNHRIASVLNDNGQRTFWIFPKFIEYYYGKDRKLENSIVWLGCCLGYKNADLVSAFYKSGAKSVIGSTESVDSAYGWFMCDAFVYQLLFGNTVGDSLAYAKQIWGDNDNEFKNRYDNSFSGTTDKAEFRIYNDFGKESTLVSLNEDALQYLNSDNTKGSISGRVVDENGNPIENATVYFEKMTQKDTPPSSVKTDKNGYFYAEGSSCSFTIRIMAEGYQEYIGESDEGFSNNEDRDAGNFILSRITHEVTEFSRFLGISIDTFIADHPDFQRIDTSDGTIEYEDAGMIVSANSPNRLIDFISIRENSHYSLYGLYCGMQFSEAEQHLTQSISIVQDSKADYKYLHLSNSMDISYHADASGKIDSVSVFVNDLIPEPDVSEDQNTEPPTEGHTYYNYYGGILENGTTTIMDANSGASYRADLSWYDLVDIDQDNEKELIAEYNVPGGGEVGRYLVIYKVEGAIISESEPISVYHANSFYLAADGNGIIYAGYTPGCYWFGHILPHTYQCVNIESCFENSGDYVAYERNLDSYTGAQLQYRPVSDSAPLNEKAPDTFEQW